MWFLPLTPSPFTLSIRSSVSPFTLSINFPTYTLRSQEVSPGSLASRIIRSATVTPDGTRGILKFDDKGPVVTFGAVHDDEDDQQNEQAHFEIFPPVRA